METSGNYVRCFTHTLILTPKKLKKELQLIFQQLKKALVNWQQLQTLRIIIQKILFLLKPEKSSSLTEKETNGFRLNFQMKNNQR